MRQDMVERAKALAVSAHEGQLDAQGRDYVEAHLAPIAAGCRGLGPEAEAAGWLHDILEDTSVSVEELREAGITEEVIDAVVAVTKVEGEPYEALIERACENPLGCYVKFVDNAWNIASIPSLSLTDPERAWRMLHAKYLPARARLRAAQSVEIDDLLDEPLENTFAKFHRYLPRTRGWAGPLRLEVTETATGDLLVFGEDQSADYGAAQHHISVRVPALEVPKVRVALGAHPLTDLKQLVIQNSELMFGGVGFTRWFSEHWIRVESDESVYER